ncbi:hypothetical protein [Methanosarcina horonobensis]|uniref:hypothetical protein n=1 Tax=Methanosarcina horonobensis TaxID=418008 RepID=UPI00138DF617|nr:hypothetical protein [Methanosarcina horonobensis]
MPKIFRYKIYVTAPTNKFAGIYGISTNAMLYCPGATIYSCLASIVSSFTFETSSKNLILEFQSKVK